MGIILERFWMTNDRHIGKFISLILRHKPETIGISLDEHGWASVDELITGINKTHPIDTGRLAGTVFGHCTSLINCLLLYVCLFDVRL